MKKPLFAIFVICLFVAGTLAGYNILLSNEPEETTPDVSKEKQTIEIKTGQRSVILNVEVADTDEEHEKGLMNRTELDENSGMLFVFTNENVRTFWMKDTLISLDMIFISSDGTIVNIAKNTQPNQIEERYSSEDPVKYVLEVNGGWSDKNGVKKGDSVIIEL